VTKTELKANINKLCNNSKPKQIDLLFWLDLELDEPQLELQVEVHSKYDDSKYYCLEVLEAGEHTEEFMSFENLKGMHIGKYDQWLNWLQNAYSNTNINDTKEVIHI
jgi:hypothetical protein